MPSRTAIALIGMVEVSNKRHARCILRRRKKSIALNPVRFLNSAAKCEGDSLQCLANSSTQTLRSRLSSMSETTFSMRSSADFGGLILPVRT